jgi:hypothetical protein
LAERTIRVVKTVRHPPKNRRRIRRDEEERKHSMKTVIEASSNFYVSNLELGSIPPVLIHQLGRSRWRIDSEVFQTMTTDGHVKRPSVRKMPGLQ